jgi:hypothetical protein
VELDLPRKDRDAIFDLISSRNLDAAVVSLEDAGRRFPSPAIHLNRTLALANANRCPDALAAADQFEDACSGCRLGPRAEPVLEQLRARCLGTIHISTIDGARIFVDGVATERSIVRRTPGTHRVRIERKGFRPEEQEVKVVAGGVTELSFELRPSIRTHAKKLHLFDQVVHEGGYEPAEAKETISFMEDLLIDCHDRTQRGADRGRALEVRFLRRTNDTSVSVFPADEGGRAYLTCIEREARLFVWPKHEGSRAVVSVKVGF